MFDWDIFTNSDDFETFKKNLISKRFGEISNLDISSPIDFLKNGFFDEEFNLSIRKAKELILDSIKNNELIIIHGDYDCDGVCATTIIYRTIRDVLGYKNCVYLIPDRFEDGYGLSNNTLRKIYDISFNQKFLLITVDCGISSFSQIEDIKRNGNKVVLSDHHHKPEILPNADIIIWSDKVVGSTLSWILSLSLGNKDTKFMSYATIATISDVFPLININRSIVKHGLEILKKEAPFAIKALMKKAGKEIKDISTYDLGFVIGPRLNSSGRIGSADFSIELLIHDNEDEIEKYCSEIEEVNKKRQQITEESLKNLNIDPLNLPKIVVVYDENFHEGVMGLIASRIVGKYNRPALVISKSDGFLKGSARSIKGVNIIDLLVEHKDLFISVGGHELAAGFSLEESNLEILKEKLSKYMDTHFENFSFKKKISIDASIPLKLINLDTLSFLEKLEPFGPSNEEPNFCTFNAIIRNINFIGKEKNHLSLIFSDGTNDKKGLLFNFDEKYKQLYLGQKVDIAYKIRKNEYNNNTSAELNIIDIKLDE